MYKLEKTIASQQSYLNTAPINGITVPLVECCEFPETQRCMQLAIQDSFVSIWGRFARAQRFTALLNHKRMIIKQQRSEQ